jgi:Fusaric acid resistance protein-like
MPDIARAVAAESARGRPSLSARIFGESAAQGGALLWLEALRAAACMAPMLVAYGLGNQTFLVPLGQGAFFYCAQFLPADRRGRILMGSIVVALGLGFYLIGGNVIPNIWLAILFTFLVPLNLSFLSAWRLDDWRVGGALALTFMMIFTAGLNSGSPERTSANFLAFCIAMGWSAVISALPLWPAIPPAAQEATDIAQTAEQGVRMGIGSSVALFVSFLFGFDRFGWAPSAVGNIVRFNEHTTKARARARSIGTIGGASVALVALFLAPNLAVLIVAAVVFASLNGLYKARPIGRVPFFYTATIILLYSAFDLESGPEIALQRVAYNLVGIAIGLFVVLYPFPVIMRRLRTGL